MANSNNRIKEPETVHHLVSRIAHRVYFLKDEERNEFIDMMRRTAEFCGIKLIGWCIMTNHFHILAYLPQPQALDEDEILRRYGVLKGLSAASSLSRTLLWFSNPVPMLLNAWVHSIPFGVWVCTSKFPSLTALPVV